MRLPPLSALAFPLAILAFAAIGTKYVGAIFTPTTRWAFMAILLWAIVVKRGVGGLKLPLGLVLPLYMTWCLMTAVWSPVQDLSLMKAVAVVFVTTAFLAGARLWVGLTPTLSPLAHLVPIAVLGLAAGVISRGTIGADEGFRQGLTANSNQLGILVAVGCSVLFYYAYVAFSRRLVLRTVVLSALIVLAAYLLWAANSRAAIVCATLIAVSGFIVLRPSRRLLIATLVSAAAATVLIISPSVRDGLYLHLIIKNETGADAEGGQDVFNSRRGPWQESYDGAVEGGLLGLGYGVSAGHNKFEGGLTAQNYGREKGNSQLAIVEEMGLVGLLLYLLLLGAIFRGLLRGVQDASDGAPKVAMALLLGTALGLFSQSIFEAWWTAPGSAESAIFWATVGVGLALSARTARSPASIVRARMPEGKPTPVHLFS